MLHIKQKRKHFSRKILFFVAKFKCIKAIKIANFIRGWNDIFSLFQCFFFAWTNLARKLESFIFHVPLLILTWQSIFRYLYDPSKFTHPSLFAHDYKNRNNSGRNRQWGQKTHSLEVKSRRERVEMSFCMKRIIEHTMQKVWVYFHMKQVALSHMPFNQTHNTLRNPSWLC